MLELYTKLQARLAQEDGQTMAEYAVVLAVIAIGIFIALGALSGAIGGDDHSAALLRMPLRRDAEISLALKGD